MSETAHTPLPWHIFDGHVIASKNNGTVAFAYGSMADTRGETNAAFIVKACNAHHDLVEAVKAQHEALDWCFAQLIARSPRDDVFYPSESAAWPAMLQANAALKKAAAE